MANEVDEKAAKAIPKQQAKEPVDDGLVPVSKDGETLRVHPSCVEAHKKTGWR